MLPDLLATATLVTLAIYHLMIYWGRRKDAEETYNLYFAIFVFAASLFVIAPYFQPDYFLYSFKPSWLYVLNIEALMVWCLFFSGIKFLNLLLKVPPKLKRYLYFTLLSLPFNFLLTLTSNFISLEFYFTHILNIILIIVLINVIVVYSVYGLWVYRSKLYKENFYRILYIGFISLTTNILIYRTLELLTSHRVMVFNHYLSAFILYSFAYALSMKFNKEYFDLKEMKIDLEKKVEERTSALEKSNRLLGNQNVEIQKQKEEIVSINHELSLRAEELSDLNQARSRFFTGISHEFRTPLTLIMGPLENLLSGVVDNKTRTDYELMLGQARRLLELINQLLELSKLQNGVQTLTVSADNLNLFIRTIISAHQPLAKDLNVELVFIEESTASRIWFDKDKLEKIITNLLTNALKFTNRGGKVEVVLSMSNDEEFVELVFRDNGIGIEPKQLEYVFEPFYQVDSSRNSRLEGTGIGLSLVKELTALHKGKIRVNSVMHQGTEFFICIPATQSFYSVNEFLNDSFNKARFDSEEALDVENQNLNKKKKVILLVEDNQDMRSFIKSCLPVEYRIIEACNGKEGLERANEEIPDLIIADVMMPILTGLEMTRTLKLDERTSHIPVIILTAKASNESKLEGLSTQVDDYVTKPFSSNELTLRIQNLLANRARLREKFSRSITVNPSELVTTSVDEQFLQKALQIVENNMSETEFSAEQFCDDICMSRAHVHRKLKALTGQSASHFIRSIRLKRAAQLLKQNSASVSEIAYQTGFNNLSYFTRSFKEQYGELPSFYLTLNKNN